MPQTIYGGQVGSDLLPAGSVLTVTVDVGNGAIVERISGGQLVEKTAAASTTSFGPYLSDMVFRLSAFPGATVRTSIGGQTAERSNDSEAAAGQALVSDARITTWANRAALVTAGIFTAFFTDVGVGGGSWWYYSGGRWRPTGGRVVLRNLTSSVTHNTTVRTVMDYALLQAGLWQDGDILEMEWCKTLTGTDTDATETALGTVAGTFGESMVIVTSGLTNTNPMVSARWRWRRLGATSVRVVSVGGSTGLGAVGAVLADPTITTNLDTTDSYLQISGDLTSGAGAVTALRAHTVTLVCGA